MKDLIVLSGFVRYKPNKKHFLLMINSRRLAKIFSKKKIKASVKREDQHFLIYQDEQGNTIRTNNGKEVSVSISSKKLLTQNEKLFLQDKKNKNSFTTKIKIDLDSFEINQFDLYPDQDAALLAKALSFRGVVLPKRLITHHNSFFDLEFKYNGLEVNVEITKTPPSGITVKDYRHQALGGKILSHIFDSYRKNVNDIINKKKSMPSFVVISKGWKKYNYFKDLFEEMKTIGCYPILVDFKENWPEHAASYIIETLNNY